MAQSRRFAARARREDPIERVAGDASSDGDLDSDHGPSARRRKGRRQRTYSRVVEERTAEQALPRRPTARLEGETGGVVEFPGGQRSLRRTAGPGLRAKARPEEARFPRLSVLIRREERAHLLEQLTASPLRELAEPPHRLVEREERGPLERLRICDPQLLELLEARAGERLPPRPGREARPVEVDRVVTQLIPRRRGVREESLGLGGRRLRRAARDVPHQDEDPLGAKDALDLGDS